MNCYLNCMSLEHVYCLACICAIEIHRDKWEEAWTTNMNIKQRYEESLPWTLIFTISMCEGTRIPPGLGYICIEITV